MSGFFIVLEGTEGSGKSTVAIRLAEAFRARGRAVTAAREPGGTVIGEGIRALLLGTEAAGMSANTETLLFAASRAQLVFEVVRPALERGDVVIVDRYSDSSLAYQWGGRGLALDLVQAAQALATNGLQPDLKILLDLPVALGLQRRFTDGSETNRMDRETVAFHERVRQAYHALAAADPERWRTVDASRPAEDVWSEVWTIAVAMDHDRTTVPTGSADSALGGTS